MIGGRRLLLRFLSFEVGFKIGEIFVVSHLRTMYIRIEAPNVRTADASLSDLPALQSHRKRTQLIRYALRIVAADLADQFVSAMWCVAHSTPTRSFSFCFGAQASFSLRTKASASFLRSVRGRKASAV